jgi:hypothetical protein
MMFVALILACIVCKVLNADLPPDPETFFHRVGRTGLWETRGQKCYMGALIVCYHVLQGGLEPMALLFLFCPKRKLGSWKHGKW